MEGWVSPAVKAHRSTLVGGEISEHPELSHVISPEASTRSLDESCGGTASHHLLLLLPPVHFPLIFVLPPPLVRGRMTWMESKASENPRLTCGSCEHSMHYGSCVVSALKWERINCSFTAEGSKKHCALLVVTLSMLIESFSHGDKKCSKNRHNRNSYQWKDCCSEFSLIICCDILTSQKTQSVPQESYKVIMF